MKVRIGTFAKNYTQAKIISLTHKDENWSFYTVKLPFRKFALVITKN